VRVTMSKEKQIKAFINAGIEQFSKKNYGEAMFISVPTIALMGESHVSRVSAALNLQAGFPEFVAKTEQ